MKITRRFFLSFLLIASLAATSLGDPTPTHTYFVFVGTYIDKTDSKGIYAFEFDADSGKLTPKGSAAETDNPSWIALHPTGQFLLAENQHSNSIVVFRIVDLTTGALTEVSRTDNVPSPVCLVFLPSP